MTHLGHFESLSSSDECALSAEFDDDTEAERSLRLHAIACWSDGADIRWDNGRGGDRCLWTRKFLSVKTPETSGERLLLSAICDQLTGRQAHWSTCLEEQ